MTEQQKTSLGAARIRSVGVAWLAGWLAVAPVAAPLTARAQAPAAAPAELPDEPPVKGEPAAPAAPASAAPASATPPVPATAAPATAAPATVAPATAALDRYRATMLEMRPAMGGLSGFQLRVGGKEADLGFFGEDAATVFKGSPEALAAAERFRTRRIAGTALWGAGMGALVLGMVLTLTGSSIVFDKNSSDEFTGFQPGFYVLLLGGGVAGMAGGIVIQSAIAPLNEAVDAYNEHLYQQAKAPPSLRVSGTF